MKELSDVEIQQQLRRYNSGEDEPPWQGAIPDVDKLTATIQTDPNEMWWRGSKCDLCIYEADVFYLEVYYCRPHWEHFTAA